MDELAGELLRVGVAEHVPLPDDAAHPSQLHTHRLIEAHTAALKPLLALGDLPPHGRLGKNRQPGIFVVAVGEEHARHLPLDLHRLVEIAGHKEAGQAFEDDLRHGVAAAESERVGHLDGAVDRRVERCLAWRGPETLGHQHPLANLLAASLPGLTGGRRRERKEAIEILERLTPGIGRSRLRHPDDAYNSKAEPCQYGSQEPARNPPPQTAQTDGVSHGETISLRLGGPQPSAMPAASRQAFVSSTGPRHSSLREPAVYLADAGKFVKKTRAELRRGPMKMRYMKLCRALHRAR